VNIYTTIGYYIEERGEGVRKRGGEESDREKGRRQREQEREKGAEERKGGEETELYLSWDVAQW
jgi:hypothetical protein